MNKGIMIKELLLILNKAKDNPNIQVNLHPHQELMRKALKIVLKLIET